MNIGEAARPNIRLIPYADHTHKVGDPLIVRPKSAVPADDKVTVAENEKLLEYSKMRWNNSNPFKIERINNGADIRVTPCDPMGTATIQTSDTIAAQDISGIKDPTRGRFIKFEWVRPGEISAVLTNSLGRELTNPHSIIENDGTTGSFATISNHLLGEPFLPVPYTNFPSDIKKILDKRLNKHDQLTPEEVRSCVFDPKINKLERGIYKFAFYWDGDAARLFYGRSMGSGGKKPLRPGFSHQHLSGNAEVFLAGTISIGATKKDREILEVSKIDNNTSGYVFKAITIQKESEGLAKGVYDYLDNKFPNHSADFKLRNFGNDIFNFDILQDGKYQGINLPENIAKAALKIPAPSQHPPVENLLESVKWLREHEGGEAFRNLDLDNVIMLGKLTAFKRDGASTRSPSRAGTPSDVSRSDSGSPYSPKSANTPYSPITAAIKEGNEGYFSRRVPGSAEESHISSHQEPMATLPLELEPVSLTLILPPKKRPDPQKPGPSEAVTSAQDPMPKSGPQFTTQATIASAVETSTKNPHGIISAHDPMPASAPQITAQSPAELAVNIDTREHLSDSAPYAPQQTPRQLSCTNLLSILRRAAAGPKAVIKAMSRPIVKHFGRAKGRG